MVRAIAVLLGVLPATCLWAADPATKSKADPIIERYLAIPYLQDDRGESSSARSAVLRELEAVPQEAVASIDAALKRVTDARRRAELVEVLGHFRRVDAAEAQKRARAPATTTAPAGTPAEPKREPASPAADAAKVLIGALQDSDEEVRFRAIRSLDALAGRVDRPGRTLQSTEEHEPAVPGLLPHLLKAANDSSGVNRLFALYALADTREPAAVAELHHRLKDADPGLRFAAACLLTEFDNVAGLPELKDNLRRLLRQTNESYWDAVLLVDAFERVTGKSFGAVPMDPRVSSNGRIDPQAVAKRYHELLKAWSDWWEWDPKAKPSASILP